MTASPFAAEGRPRSHHGEYKVPGGKLVVVDFDVVDGVLADDSLSGDFSSNPTRCCLGPYERSKGLF